MHVGSQYAVCSPDAAIGGRGLAMTDFNKDMYEYWCDVIDSKQQPTDIMVLNGEPIDGANNKSGGTGVWTTNVMEQLNDAERLMRMHSWRELLMTRGSRYHVAVNNMAHEEVLARTLGATPYSGMFSEAMGKQLENKHFKLDYDKYGQYTDNYLWFVIGGKRFSVCHHIGYNKVELYRTSALSKETAVMKFAEGRWYPEGESVNVIVRSHVHYYVEIRYVNQIAFTTPCWKLPDEFQLKGGLGGTAVNVGAIEVIVEPNGKVDTYPYVMEPKRYPKPYEINYDTKFAEMDGICR